MSQKEKPESQPLKLLIDDLLKVYGLDHRVNERKLVKLWEEMVGPMIVKHTQQVHFKKNVLYIKMDSAAIRQEMSYAKTKLMEQLNQGVGKEVVKDMVFR